MPETAEDAGSAGDVSGPGQGPATCPRSDPPIRAEDYLLLATHISKSYSGNPALRDVTLQVRPGEVHGIVGENGAGKSTLIGIVSGGLAPDTGDVWIGGDRLRSVSPATARSLGVAVVHQEPKLIPDLSVAESMYLGLPPAKRPPVSSLRNWARGALEAREGGSGTDVTARVAALVPEDRFVVAICAAIAARPRVLLLDEPTEHLGPDGVRWLMARVADVIGEGGAVVYISHRVAEVREISDRITVLREGRSQGTYPAAELADDDVVRLIVGRDVGALFPDKAPPGLGPEISVGEARGSDFSVPPLTLKPGEIVGLAGIEGSGQRDYIRTIAGLNPAAHAPTITIDGRRRTIRSVKKAAEAGITFVSSDRHAEGLFGTLSVGENLVMRSLPSVSSAGFVSSARERGRVDELIRQFDVRPPRASALSGELSGGNQQKVVLGAAMAGRCRLLLIEEPTQGVDIGTRAEIYRTLRARAAAEQITCIVTSSNSAELAGLCDRVLVFSRGHVVRDLRGDDVNEHSITESILSSNAMRQGKLSRVASARTWLAGNSAPGTMVAAVTVLLGLITYFSNSRFLSGGNVGNMLLVAVPLIFSALAQGAVLLVGAIDLSVGPLMGAIVAVGSFYWVPHASVGLVIAGIAVILAIALGTGLANWALADGLGLHPMVATIVTFFALEAVGLIVRPQPGGVYDTGAMNILTFEVGSIPIAAVVAALVAVGLLWVLVKTPFGIAFRSVGSHPHNAAANGVRPKITRLVAYVSCSLLATIGAVALASQVGYGDPSVGTSYTLASISAAIVGGISLFGGRGGFVGALLGALLLGEALSVTTFLNLSSSWDSYLEGALILVAVLIYSRSRRRTLGA